MFTLTAAIKRLATISNLNKACIALFIVWDYSTSRRGPKIASDWTSEQDRQHGVKYLLIFLEYPKLSLSSAHEFVTTRFPKENPKFRRETKSFVIPYRRSFTMLKLFVCLFFFNKFNGLHITSQSLKLGVTVRDKVDESTWEKMNVRARCWNISDDNKW